jgi:hypothetical protein
MTGKFTEAQFHRWDAALSKTSPGAASAEQIANATLVTGCVLQAMGDGVILRLTNETGQTQTFNLNAAMALRLAASIPAAARMALWLDERGVVIARPDPKP